MKKVSRRAALHIGLSAMWLSVSTLAAFAGGELSFSQGSLIEGNQEQGGNGSHVGFNQIDKSKQFAATAGATSVNDGNGDSLNSMRSGYAQRGAGGFGVSSLNAQAANGAALSEGGATSAVPGSGVATAHHVSATSSSGQAYSYNGSAMLKNGNPSYLGTFSSPKQTVNVELSNGTLTTTKEPNM